MYWFNYRLLLVVMVSFVLTSCATLNKDECLNANWKLIGHGDASRGQKKSRIDAHREACAEYNIKPNWDEYVAGWNIGIKTYCTLHNGIYIGEHGKSYNGVCPKDQSADFLRGHDYGKQLHRTKQEATMAANTASSKKQQLKQLKKDIRNKELAIISSKTTPEVRTKYLLEVKDSNQKVGAMQQEIVQLEKKAADKQREYQQLSQDRPKS